MFFVFDATGKMDQKFCVYWSFLFKLKLYRLEKQLATQLECHKEIIFSKFCFPKHTS